MPEELHPSIESPRMKPLQEGLHGEYLACKALGAGGGGSMIFLVEEAMRDSLIKHTEAMSNILPGSRGLPFSFDYTGLRVEPLRGGSESGGTYLGVSFFIYFHLSLEKILSSLLE
jgi:hypothetical protein